MSIRFIAGAVCPRCGEMDTLKAGSEDDGNTLVRECVDCGYIDRISQGINTPKEVDTRVTPKQPEPDDADAVPVKIIDPNPREE